MAQYVTKEDVLNASEDGLQIFFALLPQINQAKPKDHFKLRPESTASTNLFYSKRTKTKQWMIKDHGSGEKAMDAISFYMKERGLEFGDAMKELASMFNLMGSGTFNLRSSTYEKLDPTDQTSGISYEVDPTEGIMDKVAHHLGPLVNSEVCEIFNVVHLSHYIIHKEDCAHKYASNENYPIFLIDYGPFQKIIQPYAEKKHRFLHIGERPDDFICGLKQLENCKEQQYTNFSEPVHQPRPKWRSAILCSGESDALNVAAMGFNVIWMNSETQLLTFDQYRQITSLVHDLYYLGDIDSTGLKQAYKYGMRFLDMRIIRLPDELKQKKDKRGYQCKDAKDYLTHYPEWQFEKLVQSAYPFKFWDVIVKRDNENGIKEIKYSFNAIHCINFLEWNGFHKITSKNSKTGYTFIKKDDHVITEVDHQRIRGFINSFVRDRKFNTDIINLVLKTNQLSENALTNLREVEIDFRKADQDFQLFFFDGEVWRITKTEITKQKPDDMDRFVWNDQVIKSFDQFRQPKLEIQGDFFTVTYNEITGHDIEIKDQSNPFFQFLINTSRMFWKDEFQKAGEDPYQSNEAFAKKGLNLINGKHLKPDQIKEQKQHLVNKLYTIGYMLHNHKNPARAWMPFAIDNQITEVTESHGGSGKSIIFDCLKIFLKTVKLNGRNGKLMENSHAFENVTTHSDFVYFDDCRNGFDIGFLFPFITGDMEVNPKHAKSFNIPFTDSPKLACTSNYSPRNVDSSTERRLLYTVNSDFYHYRSDMNTGSKTPQDDLGMILLQDFTPEQWNGFFNLMAQCVKLYLNYPKIEPPMDNVDKRNLRALMGDNFFHWATQYLTEKVNVGDGPTDNDKYINCKDAREDFKDATGFKSVTTNKFNKNVKAWCQYHGFVFNHGQDDRNGIPRVVEGKTDTFYHILKSTAHMTDDQKKEAEKTANTKAKSEEAPY